MRDHSRNPVGKAIEALIWLVESDQQAVGVRELAGALNMSPSSAHRILHELVEAGLVAQQGDRQDYGLGVGFFRIVQRGLAKLPLHQVAADALRSLVAACNETALLGLYDPARQEMFFAACVESTHTLRYAIELNTWVPVHTGASGLAIMAFLPPAEIDALMDRGLPRLTDNSIDDPAVLRRELEKVRRNGYAVTRGQRIVGAVGLAVPIFDITGRVVGDVCLTIPEGRFNARNQSTLIKLMKAAAAQVSRSAGWQK